MATDNKNEIERRFMPIKWSTEHHFPFNLPRINIRQGYFELPVKDRSLRVRVSDNTKAELTSKSGKGIERPEKPHPLYVDYAKMLIEDYCSHYLEKVRHVDGRWEIDFFDSPLSGLVLMEIELRSRDEDFTKPKYVEEWVEVTDSLTNHHLARLATQLRENKLPVMPYIYSHVFSSVPKIVITGGPCSGKTDILALLSQRSDLQCVPEVASIVISQLSIKPKKEINDFFQRLVHNTQSLFEDTSLQYAVIEGRSGLILDRGLPDGAAYFEGGISEYEKVIKTNVAQEYSLYKLIICLDVAPEDIYELKKANNSARSETYKEACEKGDRVRRVWQNHPNFVFVSNDGGWDEKVRKVKEAIDKVLR